jgi:uncharacterized membrane protein HdeD (DUF308 family)
MGKSLNGRCAVTQSSIKSQAPLALCAAFNALFSAAIFFILSPDASPILRSFIHARSAIEQIGALALAAGVCAIAAALWNSAHAPSWLLASHGLICSALGFLIVLGATRPVAFRTIALFIAGMAVTLALHLLAAARARRLHPADKWLLATAAGVSLGFAAAFAAFALRWFPLDPSPSAQTFHWLGSYFAFAATSILLLSLRPLQPRQSRLRIVHRNPLPIA